MAKRSNPKLKYKYGRPGANRVRSDKNGKKASSTFKEPMDATKVVLSSLAHRFSALKDKDILTLLASIYAVYANYVFLWMAKSPSSDSIWTSIIPVALIAAFLIIIRYTVVKFSKTAIQKFFVWVRSLAPFGLVPILILYAQESPAVILYVALVVGTFISGIIAFRSVPLLFQSSGKQEG